jgi:hypothetical protein
VVVSGQSCVSGVAKRTRAETTKRKRRKEEKEKRPQRRKKQKKKKTLKNKEMGEAASLTSVYAFGIRTSQAIFVQDIISLFAEPLFDSVVATAGIADTIDPTVYRALRVLFRFVVAIASLRCVGFLLGIA